MTTDPLHFLNIPELGRRFRDGSLSPVNLTEHLIGRIDRLDAKLGAFRTVTRERALGEARAAEAALKAGQDLGPLHGIPYVAKDLFDVKGEATMAGTRLLEDNVAEADCHVVRKCAQAGMVLLGKTHTVQFAFGGVGINNDLGTPHNPWNAVHHVPGGSSSGTAVSVAAGLATVGLGSDTGGSVRIPAALCGIAGLKTTIGRIGRSGVYPLSWTLDSVGPLGRGIEDCALFYQALTGEDPEDETTHGISPHRIAPHGTAPHGTAPHGTAPHGTAPPSGDGLRGMRMAFCETVFFDDVDPEVAGAVRAAGGVFESLGAQVGAIELPEVAECFTFGKRDLFIAAEALAVNGHWMDNHFEQLDPVISTRLLPGREMTATDYFLLLRKWAELRRKVVERMGDVEVLIVPTTMITAKPVEVAGANQDAYREHNQKYLRNTILGNRLDLCGATVPCGFDGAGLPIGLMLYAKPFHEELALRAAVAFEQAAGFLGRRPDLSWAGD